MPRTIKQDRAIASFCKQGFRPELSAHPTYRFTNIKTGEVVILTLSTLVQNYENERRAENKEKTRLRRQEKKGV